METLLNDIRYGARMLLKSKGLTIIAVLSLAVGIGANTAIFGIVNAVLFRARPVANPDQLVELYKGRADQPYQSTSYPSYLDFRQRNQVFTDLAGYGVSQFKLGGADQVEQIWGEVVTGNYFQVLGVQPVLGRAFLPEEDRTPGTNPVAIIGYGLWQRRFNSDPQLIGKTITLNNQTLTVIGVAPREYTGMFRGLSAEIWVPAMMRPALEGSKDLAFVNSRGSSWLVLVGRLKPGTTIDQARARFDLLIREMKEAHPDEWQPDREDSNKGEYLVTILPESQTRIHPQMHTAAYALIGLLMVIVNLVLIIAGINLVSLLLARAVTRRREIAVRLALGASRVRIVRQLLTESLLLALIAGAAGVVLTLWLLSLIVALLPPLPEGVRLAIDLGADWKVFFFGFGFAAIAGLLFGLVPALQSSRPDLITILKNESGAFAGRYLKSRLRATLVVAQIAFSFLLLIGAGLILRSLEKVRPTRLGFESTNVLVAPITLDPNQYDRLKSQELYSRLIQQIGGLPGVQSVSMVDAMPGGVMGSARRTTAIEGYQPSPGEDMQIHASIVGPNYFTSMKIPFVAGRDFDVRDRDGAPCVAIINEAFTRRYFPSDTQPLGKHLTKLQYKQPDQRCEIVGVVQDNKLHALQREPRPTFAFALLQSHQTRTTMLVNTAVEPGSLALSVRKTIQALDPTIPLTDIQTVTDSFSAFLYPFRIFGVVMGTCGVLALMLASIGIYGVVSFGVAQRTKEVGIRMALGAIEKDILKLVLAQSMGMVLCGLGAGLVLSLVLTQLLASPAFELELLLGVSPTDSLTFVGVTVVLTIVGLVACYIPARRATKVDPVVSLRYE